MYLGKKEIDQIKNDKTFVRVTFKEIEGEQPKPLLTSQDFIDWCATEELEENAENRFKEKRTNFYAKVILDTMDGFTRDIAELCETKDQDKAHESMVALVQEISDNLLVHNVPLEDWHDVINQATSLINQQTGKIKSWLEETFILNTSKALKKLFKEGEHDIRTYNDVHILQ